MGTITNIVNYVASKVTPSKPVVIAPTTEVVLPKHTGCSDELFETIVRFAQPSLKRFLMSILKSAGYSPIAEDGFIYAWGTDPVILTAHMDTVHKNLPTIIVETKVTKEGREYTKVESPFGIGGDDRCGVWMIVSLLQKTSFRPTILFCEDEEVGCVGCKKFVKTDWVDDIKEKVKPKFIIELDRKNATDAVFYNCDNPDFTTFIEEQTGYEKAWGSCSDISTLAPAVGVAAVNLSCGYYNPHTNSEYVLMEEMEQTLRMVNWLMYIAVNGIPSKDEDAEEDMDARYTDVPVFEYIEKKVTYGTGYYGSYGAYQGVGSSGYYGSYYGRRNYYDDDYDDEEYWNEYYAKRYGQQTAGNAGTTTPAVSTPSTASTTDGADDTEEEETTTHSAGASTPCMYDDDEVFMEITYISATGAEESDVISGHTKKECWGNFFFEHPDICYNSVLDYYYY